MTPFLASTSIMGEFIEKILSDSIFLEKDIPDFIFKKSGYFYYFFERPIMDYTELLTELIKNNNSIFQEKSFIYFGNPKNNDNYFIEFSENISEINFNNINYEKISYPIILSNINLDWIAYESAYEEIGILAIKKNAPIFFRQKIEENFITIDQIYNFSLGGFYAEVSKILFEKYSNINGILEDE